MNLLTKMFVTIVTMFITLPTLAQSLESEGRSDLNLRSGVTDISSQVYDLHMLMFMVCVGIAVVVFGVMFISMFLSTRNQPTFMRVSKLKLPGPSFPLLF